VKNLLPVIIVGAVAFFIVKRKMQDSKHLAASATTSAKFSGGPEYLDPSFLTIGFKP